MYIVLNVFVLIESGGGYDPREMLSDAVATMVFMPTKFERTSYQLAEKFNFSVHDVNTLTVSFFINLNRHVNITIYLKVISQKLFQTTYFRVWLEILWTQA